MIDHLSAVILCVGYDGTGGPTHASGGYADEQTVVLLREKRIDIGKYLEKNDAYHGWEQLKI